MKLCENISRNLCTPNCKFKCWNTLLTSPLVFDLAFFIDWCICDSLQRNIYQRHFCYFVAIIVANLWCSNSVRHSIDQVWSILHALELLPLDSCCGVNSWGGAMPMQAKWIKLDLDIAHIQISSSLNSEYFIQILHSGATIITGTCWEFGSGIRRL